MGCEVTKTWHLSEQSYEGRDSSIVTIDRDGIFRGNRRVAFWTLERAGGKLKDAGNYVAILNPPLSGKIRANSRSELLALVRGRVT